MMKITARTSIVLFASTVATSSAQTPAGGEFRVNAYTTGQHAAAFPAMEPDGDFAVVWTSSPDGINVDVSGRRFAASGAPRGGDFEISVHTTGRQGTPAVAVGSRGDFIAVWEDVRDGSASSIQGRLFDSAGNGAGGEFQVNTYTTGYQQWPRVGRASDGRFVVIWTTENDGSGRSVAARRFDASGSPIGGEFRVNTHTTYSQYLGDLAVDANGDFVVVWWDRDTRDGSGSAIIGQRYDASGNPLGSEFQVNSYTPGNQSFPAVSGSPAGGFVVVWQSHYIDGSSYGVVARRFDALGSALGNDFVVNTYTTYGQFSKHGAVSHDAHGNFVVTWNGEGGVPGRSFGQRFDASGARRGVQFLANTLPTADRTSVACDPVGNFVVTADDFFQGSGLGIYAQRFGGLAPAALAVDAPGNGVLQPGESVDVRPSWRNFNGAPQTISATLASMTGPAGATYTILDGAGNYGTIADGATGPCADCYRVSVSNPTVRPVLHWDASAVESIVPDTQGQQQEWLLHVGDSFTDVPAANAFYRFVETLLHRGVTGGCAGRLYCPGNATTREQMAVFVLVAKEGTGYTPPACVAGSEMFADVPASSPFCPWIEELARRGVVGGCGGGNYCPSASATREQMAVFVLRTLDPALNPPACASPMFADVPATSGFCRWIEELARRGVVTGCGGGNYCPTASVTREQMGVFISATFGLTLYGA